ncbi:hypothetical protein SAMN05421755_10247 [Nitrosomonas sp. Nm33]|nr:hypothetical protein SAMN05421755_10247 [Nitrosomonas sp. Nm33]
MTVQPNMPTLGDNRYRNMNYCSILTGIEKAFYFEILFD